MIGRTNAVMVRQGQAEYYAVISVVHPRATNCTCSDGTTTLVAPNDDGEYLFAIPYNGTWTVRALVDGFVRTKSVVISREYQCEFVYFETVYLYDNGTINQDLTGGFRGIWGTQASHDSIRLTFSDDHISMTSIFLSGSHYADTGFATGGSINISQYNLLGIKYTGGLVPNSSDNNSGLLLYRTISSSTAKPGDIISRIDVPNAEEASVVTLDISSVNYAYVAVKHGAGTGAIEKTINIYEMWLA